MKNEILAFLKWYPFDPKNINESINNKEFRLINMGLRKYNFKTRSMILKVLLESNVDEVSIVRRLIIILKDDFLENAALALKILKQTTIKNAKLKTKFEEATIVYDDKIRRAKNLKLFNENYKTKPVTGMLFDKSKMKRLEIVREQLKEAIRMH